MSKDTVEPQATTDDMVEIFSNTGMGKKTRRSVPKIVLAADHQGLAVLLPAKGCRRGTVTFEEIRLALLEVSLASTV